MNGLREEARTFRKSRNFLEAVEIYEKLWNSLENKLDDKWLAWEYADSLKKIGKIDDSILICRQIREICKDFKYINDLFAWCLYEKYFKNVKEKYSIQEEYEIFEKGKITTELVGQEPNTPFESVIFKILKILKGKPNYPADKILFWLNKIDYNLLSEESFLIETDGKTRELQSRKEMYFALKTKALFEKKQCEECIECCDLAVDTITRFHHDNDIWIQSRKAKCIGMLGDFNTAKEILDKLCQDKEHWALFRDIASLYYKSGDIINSLLFAYRAALTKDPPNMKVQLYHSIGLLLKEKGDKEYALLHFLFERQIRQENDWSISQNLESYISELNTDKRQTPSLHDLKAFWTKEIKKIMGSLLGTVSSILPNGKAGFIAYDQRSIYFRMLSVLNARQIKLSDKVNFCITDSFDKKKNAKTKEAVYIEKI